MFDINNAAIVACAYEYANTEPALHFFHFYNRPIAVNEIAVQKIARDWLVGINSQILPSHIDAALVYK